MGWIKWTFSRRRDPFSRSGCKVLTGIEYIARYNNLLKILLVFLGEGGRIIAEEAVWCRMKLQKGEIQNDKVKMYWDF